MPPYLPPADNGLGDPQGSNNLVHALYVSAGTYRSAEDQESASEISSQ